MVTQSPQAFKGGTIWNVMVGVHGAVKAIGLAITVASLKVWQPQIIHMLFRNDVDLSGSPTITVTVNSWQLSSYSHSKSP